MYLRKNIYLLGIEAQNEITGNKLPSKIPPLDYFLPRTYLKKSNKDNTAAAIKALKVKSKNTDKS